MDNGKVTKPEWVNNTEMLDNTLEIEVPTPIDTIRPGREVPEAARPEGPLELVYPPRAARVLYCEVLTDRSKLDELVRYRPEQGKSEKQGSNGWTLWPIELLAVAALISIYVIR